MMVEFHYVVIEGDAVLETSKNSDPMRYIHGHNAMLPGIEKALAEKQTGDTLTVTLPPAEAYGEYVPGQVQRFSAKQLEHPNGVKKPKWRSGDVAILNAPQGQQQVTIVKPGRFMVECDFNHPFAGKTLTFDLEVVDVRPATAEELSAGGESCCDTNSCGCD